MKPDVVRFTELVTQAAQETDLPGVVCFCLYHTEDNGVGVISTMVAKESVYGIGKAIIAQVKEGIEEALKEDDGVYWQ